MVDVPLSGPLPKFALSSDSLAKRISCLFPVVAVLGVHSTSSVTSSGIMAPRSIPGETAYVALASAPRLRTARCANPVPV